MNLYWSDTKSQLSIVLYDEACLKSLIITSKYFSWLGICKRSVKTGRINKNGTGFQTLVTFDPYRVLRWYLHRVKAHETIYKAASEEPKNGRFFKVEFTWESYKKHWKVGRIPVPFLHCAYISRWTCIEVTLNLNLVLFYMMKHA